MAYRFHHHESAQEAVRRIALEEVKTAVDYLSPGCRKPLPEAVHEARKSIKKVRALLRLVRPHLGSVYNRLNRSLRDIARELSEYRDADALLETFQKLRPALKGVPASRLTAFRRELAERKRKLHQGADLARQRAQLCGALQALLPEVETLTVAPEEFAAIDTGFASSYRQGREALRRAARRVSGENLHEFRKRVKDHWYHIRLLEDVWIEMMPTYEAALKQLETALGEDHNLVLLRSVAAKSRTGKSLLAPVRQVRKNLRAQAFASGERLYDRKPREIAREFAHLWEIWRAAPKPAKDGRSAGKVTSINAPSAPDPIQTAVERGSR